MSYITKRVYQAERRVFRPLSGDASQPPPCDLLYRVESIDDPDPTIEGYATEIISLDPILGRIPNWRFFYRKRNGGAHASYFATRNLASITFSFSAPKWIVVHELSHIHCRFQHGYSPPPHGREFCDSYIHLTNLAFGEDWASALSSAFASIFTLEDL